MLQRALGRAKRFLSKVYYVILGGNHHGRVFCDRGGVPLGGEIYPSGNKNAALPALAATLLTDEPVILRNLPAIRDVETMGELLESLGVEVQRLDPHTWQLHARQVISPDAQNVGSDLFRAIRGSILIAGPFLARTGRLTIPSPGGDVIGRRRVDTHFQAFQALGAEVKDHDYFCLEAPRTAWCRYTVR